MMCRKKLMPPLGCPVLKMNGRSVLPAPFPSNNTNQYRCHYEACRRRNGFSLLDSFDATILRKNIGNVISIFTLIALMVAYVWRLGSLAIMRHRAFASNAYDLGS